MNSAVPVGLQFIGFATIIDWLLRHLSFLFQAQIAHSSTNMQNGGCSAKQHTFKKLIFSFRNSLFFSMRQQHLVGQGLLTAEVSRSHSDTSHSVGLLWTIDHPYADLYLTTHNTHIHAPSGFEPAIPASERPQTHALDRVANSYNISNIKDANPT
jgi:hypothetical protein